jgi:hypothetical protein
MSPASAGKRQREKARKERAEAKAARRLERSAAPDPNPDPLPPVDEAALLAELAELHTRFEDGELDYDDFAAAKDDVTRRLRVE